MKQARLTSMGFTHGRLSASTHMYLINSDASDRRTTIGIFLGSGLQTGETVEYFADTPKPEAVRAWLDDMGVKRSGQDRAVIADATETYCPCSSFIPEAMLRSPRVSYRTAINEGLQNARVSGAMPWAPKGLSGSEQLMEHESRANDVTATLQVTAVCQNNSTRFTEVPMLNVLKDYPMRIVQGQVAQSYFYLKTVGYLTQLHGKS